MFINENRLSVDFNRFFLHMFVILLPTSSQGSVLQGEKIQVIKGEDGATIER